MAKRFGHMKSVQLHSRWLNGQLGAMTLERMGFSLGEIAGLDRLRVTVREQLHTLAGVDLVCWCAATSPCHVDTLIALAPVYADYERLAA